MFTLILLILMIVGLSAFIFFDDPEIASIGMLVAIISFVIILT